MRQLGNYPFVLLVLIVCSLGLLGCGTLGLPGSTQATRTPTFGVPTATSAPRNTPTFTPTFAPTATSTLAPTSTSIPTLTPTSTRQPIPTAVVPAGWRKLESVQVELWVPGSYLGGDPIKDREPLVKSLRALGSEYAGYINLINQNPSPFAIYAIDSAMGSTGFITNVSVTSNQIVSTGSGETLQGGVSQQLPAQYTVLDRRNATAGLYSAERLVADSPAQGMHMRQLVYTIKVQNAAWVIVFTTADGEFLTRLPAFEQSIQTLRFKP